jgi:hypothetical protein
LDPVDSGAYISVAGQLSVDTSGWNYFHITHNGSLTAGLDGSSLNLFDFDLGDDHAGFHFTSYADEESAEFFLTTAAGDPLYWDQGAKVDLWVASYLQARTYDLPFVMLGTADGLATFDFTGSVSVTDENPGEQLILARLGSPSSVPEPATALLFGLGLVAYAGLKRRHR